MAILAHSVEVPGGKPLVIYAETDNINYFINGDLEPDVIQGPTNVQVSVSGGTRRQYPGDTSRIGFAATTRTFLKDPSRSSGSALPGRPFMLKEQNTDEGGEVRQFTYKGRFLDLHAFLRAEAAKDMTLHNASGAKYVIQATVAPGP
jgi:hypothetical protein